MRVEARQTVALSVSLVEGEAAVAQFVHQATLRVGHAELSQTAPGETRVPEVGGEVRLANAHAVVGALAVGHARLALLVQHAREAEQHARRAGGDVEGHVERQARAGAALAAREGDRVGAVRVTSTPSTQTNPLSDWMSLTVDDDNDLEEDEKEKEEDNGGRHGGISSGIEEGQL